MLTSTCHKTYVSGFWHHWFVIANNTTKTNTESNSNLHSKENKWIVRYNNYQWGWIIQLHECTEMEHYMNKESLKKDFIFSYEYFVLFV